MNPTFIAGTPASVADVNEIVREACAGYMGMVMAHEPEPKVSTDFNHAPQSPIFAPGQTRVAGRSVRGLAWYDNE